MNIRQTINQSRKMVRVSTKQNLSKLSNLHNNSVHQQSVDILKLIIQQQRSKSKRKKTTKRNPLSCKQILSLAKKRQTFSAMEMYYPNPKLKTKKKKKKKTSSNMFEKPFIQNGLNYICPLSRSNSFIVFSDKNTTLNATLLKTNKSNKINIIRPQLQPIYAAILIQKVWRGYRVRKILQQHIKDEPKSLQMLLNNKSNSKNSNKKQSNRNTIKFHQQFLKMKMASSKANKKQGSTSQNLLKYIDSLDLKGSANFSEISSIRSIKPNLIMSNQAQSFNKLSPQLSSNIINQDNHNKSSSTSRKSSIQYDQCFKRQKPILPGAGLEFQFEEGNILSCIQESQSSQFVQQFDDDTEQKNQKMSSCSKSKNYSFDLQNSHPFQTIHETNDEYITSFKNSISKKESRLNTLQKAYQKQSQNKKTRDIQEKNEIKNILQITKIYELSFNPNNNQEISKNKGFELIRDNLENFVKQSKKSLKQKLASSQITLEDHIAKSRQIKQSNQLFINVLNSTQQEYSRLVTKIYELVEEQQENIFEKIQQCHQTLNKFKVKKPQSQYFTIQMPLSQQSQEGASKYKQTLQNIETIHSNTGLQQLGLYVSNISKQLNETNETVSELQFLCQKLKKNSQNGTSNMTQRCLVQFLVQIVTGQYSIGQVQRNIDFMILRAQKNREGIIQKEFQNNINGQIQLVVQKWSKQLNKWQMEIIDEVQMESSSFFTDPNQLLCDIKNMK